MTVQELLHKLETYAPMSTAEEWDNTGFAVGDLSKEVNTVVVALDLTDAVIEEAVKKKADLILTHHPVLFNALHVLPSTHPVYRLAEKGIAAISLHTNADKAVGGVNDCLCEQLGLEEVRTAPDGMSRIGVLPAEMSASVFADYVTGCLDTAVRIKEGTSPIRTVAVCGGAAAELVLPLLSEADAAVTGEVKHHEWLSVSADKTLVDGGHYATEIAVTNRFCEWLSEIDQDLHVFLHVGKAPYYTTER